MPWLDINQERHHAYMGYVGMVRLVEEIDKALYNPIWEQVRKPAPWENPDNNWQAKAIAPDGRRGRRACRQSGMLKRHGAPKRFAIARASILARSRTRYTPMPYALSKGSES